MLQGMSSDVYLGSDRTVLWLRNQQGMLLREWRINSCTLVGQLGNKNGRTLRLRQETNTVFAETRN